MNMSSVWCNLSFFTLWSICAKWSVCLSIHCALTNTYRNSNTAKAVDLYFWVCLSVSKGALSLPLTEGIILGEVCSYKGSSCPQAADPLQDVHKVVVRNKSKACHRNCLLLRAYCLIIWDRHMQTWGMMTSRETC